MLPADSKVGPPSKRQERYGTPPLPEIRKGKKNMPLLQVVVTLMKCLTSFQGAAFACLHLIQQSGGSNTSSVTM